MREGESCYFSIDYAGNENCNGGKVSYGGSQMWFFKDGTEEWYFMFMDDYNIQEHGCGLISASDILLYISLNNKKYATKPTKKVTKNTSGNLNYDTYINYVYYMYQNYLTLYFSGVFAPRLALEIDHYSDDYNLGLNAKWCTSKKKILPRIKEMLNNKIPVSLLINSCGDKKGVHFYDWKPSSSDPYKFEVSYNGDVVDSHYVTITGLLIDNVKDRKMLEISSWGKRYYIDYKEFIDVVEKDSNFMVSNITYIKGK